MSVANATANVNASYIVIYHPLPKKEGANRPRAACTIIITYLPGGRRNLPFVFAYIRLLSQYESGLFISLPQFAALSWCTPPPYKYGK
jgi:hypothetical protein